MKRILSFLATLCLFFSVAAQENSTIKTPGYQALQIGDMVPEVVLDSVLNNQNGLLRLSELKGRLVVLDFWATSCGSCIQAMPRMDSLVEAFGGKLVILPVTSEKAEQVSTFQRSNRFLKGRRFLTVVADKRLMALFPHRMLPHEVWISRQGKVMAITGTEEVNEANVIRALSNKDFNVTKKEDVLNYDGARPLFIAGNGGSDTLFRYRSVITGMIKGLPSSIGFSYDSVKRMTIVRATNVEARAIYSLVFKGLSGLADTAVQMAGVTGMYCYELDLPSASPALVRQSVRQDLDRFFKVRSEWTGPAFRLVPLAVSSQGEAPLTL